MTTLEKILQEIEERAVCSDNEKYGFVHMKHVREIFKSHLSNNDGWIPVEERLPEYGKKVLAYGKSGEIDIASLYSRDKHMWLVGSMCSVAFDIIAWRTLPAPYRPERRDKHDRE